MSIHYLNFSKKNLFSRVLKNKTLEQDIGTTKSNSVDHAINQNVNNYTDGSRTALFVVVPLFIIFTIACAIPVYVLKRQRDHGKPLNTYTYSNILLSLL